MDLNTPPSSITINASTSNTSNNNTPPTLPLLTPKTFPLFAHLPTPLRLKIWSLASPPPRTHFVEIYAYAPHINNVPRVRYIPRLPALFSATSESRGVIIGQHGGEIVRFGVDWEGSCSFMNYEDGGDDVGGQYGVGVEDGDGDAELSTSHQQPGFYFSFTHNILFLSSRFHASPSPTATETLKLQTLTLLFNHRFVSSLRRLAVTYSARDTYSHIGPVFRPFASLEVFYLVVGDLWSARMTRNMLRKGGMGVGGGWKGEMDAGNAARRIEQVVKHTEAEETDDDGETEEDVKRREEVRARRRIVEVELRLDEGEGGC